MLEGIHKIHLIGIGGAGMRAIANILIEKGYQVSGSDVNESPITKKFKEMGADIHIGHNSDYVHNVDAVVVSTAIPESNPELMEARKKGIRVLHRSDIVKAVLDITNGIAVAGAHGKTTTTSMIGQIFEEATLDPTIIIGGEVDYLNGNSKLGKGSYSVVEADESDGSFLKLNPKIAVVTNIENDHMDHYGNMDNLLTAFHTFLEKIPEDDGIAVVCGDNTYLNEFSNVIKRKFYTYGLNEQNEYIASNVRYQEGLMVYDIKHDGALECSITLQVPGIHNVLNSLAAYVVSVLAGIRTEVIQGALYKFVGAKRRFEKKGRVHDIWVVDDYAHHPTEIDATLRAAKNMERHRLVCVFQPHRYTRTSLLLSQFAGAFEAADVIVMTDIYSAGETPIEGINGHSIPEAIKAKTGQEVHYVENFEDLTEVLAGLVQPNDLVITMGAGNINSFGPKLLKRLEDK